MKFEAFLPTFYAYNYSLVTPVYMVTPAGLSLLGIRWYGNLVIDRNKLLTLFCSRTNDFVKYVSMLLYLYTRLTLKAVSLFLNSNFKESVL